ncbi:MAG: hypothetical protein M1839_005642 [Geoglossum umbratile]|nr:MAG: hypothetical protein M1839_005642 [Geoglossum umbratile]
MNDDTTGLKAHRPQMWFPRGKDSDELKPVEEVLAERNQFWQTIKSKLTKTELMEINKNASKTSYDTDIFKVLDGETYDSLYKRVNACMVETQQGNDELSQKRATGFRRISNGMQKFAQSFNDFLRTYSGLVDVVQAVDGQYGGLAWGTLSLLFIVVANKQRIEDQIQSAIEDLRSRLPEMSVYGQIYPDSSLREEVAKVFRGVIVFARAATLYYKGHGYSRWMRAAGGARELEGKVEDIRNSVANVRARCDVLLSKTIQGREGIAHFTTCSFKPPPQIAKTKWSETYKKNQELNLKVTQISEANQELNLKVSQLQESKDRDHLTMFLTDLGLQDSAEDQRESLPEYNSGLYLLVKGSKRKEMRLATLGKEDEYARWLNCSHSCVLALSGQNHRSVASRNSLFWLSRAVTDMIEQLQERGQLVAYHLCQVRDGSAEDVLLSIIHQILKTKPSILRDTSQFDRLRGLTKRQAWRNKDIGAFSDILDGIISLLSKQTPDSGPIYIIIDRLDRCSSGQISRVQLVRALVRLATETVGLVKIMVVTRDDIWNLGKYVDEFEISEPEKWVHLSLHQQKW